MQRNEFTIQGRLPSLNDYVNACRTHWSTGARFKQDTENTIIWFIKAAQSKKLCRPVTKPVKITFFWYEHGLARDIDNIYSAKKYILDAMQKAGIIENDDRKHVVDVDDVILQTTAGHDKVIVSIQEVDDT